MASLPPTKKNWVVQQTLVEKRCLTSLNRFSAKFRRKIKLRLLNFLLKLRKFFTQHWFFKEKLATNWEKDTLYFLGKVVWMTFLWDVPTIGLVIELNTCPSKTSFGSTHFLEKKLLFFYSLLWENVPFWKLSSQILSSNNIIKVFPRRGKCCAVRW